MKYADINKKFTEVVTEYIVKGYNINTSSMRGSQGEIAKVDLTNGQEIVRIYIKKFSDWKQRTRGYEIVVGKCVDNVEPNSNSDWATIWDEHLEVIDIVRFFQADFDDLDCCDYKL